MTTQPDPSLVDQLADVLAETGDNCGPGDYRQQAVDALAWLDVLGDHSTTDCPTCARITR